MSTASPAPRPHSTSFTPTITPSPRKRSQRQRRPNSLSSPTPSKRQPLGTISVQTFQDRHRTEFAHLHTHSNDSLREKRLEAEKAELDRARREGREKRESLKAAKLAADVARDQDGKGRRPLSLVVKQTGPGRDDGAGRPTSAPLALLSPRASVNRGGRQSLNVVVENDSRADLSLASTPATEDESPADTSVSHSSYSWASQFSGETEELRAAARYIPQPSAQGELQEEEAQEELQDDEEEVLASSPEQGVYRRRKKIVALAHTVRQLEGVGSREAEDPAFFAVLEKAWNERPLNNAPTAPGTASSDNGSSPYTPNLSSRHSDNYPAYASSTREKDDGSSIHSSARRSNSVRYSYASTLHDLALDGGIEQANRIFLAKPWLRASIISTGTGSNPSDGFGSNFTAKPFAQSQGQAGNQAEAGNDRHLSLGSSPPAFGTSIAATTTGLSLASPITLQRAEVEQDYAKQQPSLRKIKGTVDGARIPGDERTASNDKQVVDDLADAEAGSSQEADGPSSTANTNGWGLGFVSDWFGSATEPSLSDPAAKVPQSAAISAPITSSITRSTTVAQFDDAPNDDSLVDVDAEGETDDGEYDYASEGEQVFHERRGEGEHTDPNSHSTSQATNLETEEARPESGILPSSQETAKAKLNANTILDASAHGDTSIDSITSDPSLHLNPSPNPDATVGTDININGSPSSNPSLPLICSTHSITSYQPTLVHLPTNLGLGLGLIGTEADPLHHHPEGQTAVIEEQEEVLSSRAGSCHSSVSCSSPSKKTKRDSSVSVKSSKSSKPVLAPIQTTLARLEGSDSQPNLNLHLDQNEKDTDGLKVHLADERFSNAYKLAQSIRVPTPSIRSPIRQSSINVLSTLLSPTLTSPTLTPTPEMEISSRWFSQDSSEDVGLMMGVAPEPATSPRASPTTLTRPLGPARTRSSSTSMVNSPVQMTPTSPSSSSATASLPKSMRRPSRPNLLDTRAATLSSISELGVNAIGGGSALAPSDTLNSTSAGSEVLSDGNDALSPSLSDIEMSTRRSRLAQTSLDSLPSYLRPPSISDSISSSSVSPGRRTSNYQAYQQRHVERSRRANARVAAKMSGATPKELKQLQIQQHQSMILGNGSPNPGAKLESQSIMVVPEPSRAACTLFFLGFFLGPWFWIFGGWMPLGHSSEIRKDEEASLDFTAADDLPKWWRWTYHPDPWVKRNRRAAAIGIPIVLCGGVAAAVAVAVVFGAA